MEFSQVGPIRTDFNSQHGTAINYLVHYSGLTLYTRSCTEALYTVRPGGTQTDPIAGAAWQSAMGSSKIEADEAWLSAGLVGRRV